MVSDETVTSSIVNNGIVNLNIGSHTITGNGTAYLFENNGILSISASNGKINGSMDSINGRKGSELNIDGVTDRMRYPINNSYSYWIGTSGPESSNALYYQLRYGNCTLNNYVNTRGVRTIIAIEY